MDADDLAAVRRAVAYAKQRQQIERRVRAAVKVRDFRLVAELAIQMQALNASAING